MLFQNFRDETKNNNVRNNKNIKLPTITNNTNKNSPSFKINKTNISNKLLSKILERNTDTNTNKTNNKYFTIDKSTVNKILSGKVQVPETIPAYKEGGPVPKQFGGKLIIAADGGVDEMISPMPNIKSSLKVNTNNPQIIKAQQSSLSSVAADSIMENTTLKQQTSDQKENVSGPPPPSVINNYTTGNSNNDSSQGFGGGTKATESMGLQTQYPIWRRGFG